MILCCLSGVPQFSKEILELCQEFKNEGVVGIDIAGDENAISSMGKSEVFSDFDKQIFREAKNLGIHRTVHAGEDGPADNVKVAIEEMFAERIGTFYVKSILDIWFATVYCVEIAVILGKNFVSNVFTESKFGKILQKRDHPQKIS